jgi:hypothetical protein
MKPQMNLVVKEDQYKNFSKNTELKLKSGIEMRKFVEGIMICGSVILGATVILAGGVRWFAEKIEKQINKDKNNHGN